MKLTTRLLVSLVPTVAAIMTLYAVWAMIEREDTLVPVLRRETEAYATSLALALSDQPRGNTQALLDRISTGPTVYAILLYDSTGAATVRSGPLSAQTPAPADTLARILGGAAASFERTIGEERVFSVLRPLLDEATGRVTGAVEVAQPLTVVTDEKARVRRRFILNTLTLVGAVTLLTLAITRRMVASPIARFEAGVRALGGGDLRHRVPVDPHAGELAGLAVEINRMAASLETAQAAAAREAEERVALERRMRETEKIAAVGNLAAGLAHEIAAPLNVISGRAELLLRPGEATDRERHLRSIIQQIDRITGTVRHLLDYARRREPRLRPCDLHAVTRGAMEFLDGELARTRVTWRVEAPEPVPVNADPDQLHQVLVNLVLNATQAMEQQDEGGRAITVTVRREGAALAVLEVRDTGPGLPEDLLPSLFQPFVTTKPRGTGLGLVVARSLVEEHGGTLEARNHPEGGAVFRLTLPLSPGAPRG